MSYKTLLFDLDGTLTDPFDGITRCVQHALACQGIEVSDRQTLAPFIGPPLAEAFAEFHGLSAEQAVQAVADYRERFAQVGMYENRVYDGIPELLAGLKAGGWQLFVATSKPWAFARPIIEHFGLSAFFDEIHGSELDGRRTDKRALLAHVLREQGLDADETLMIGDRRFDIEGARHNGVRSAAVSYGYGSAEELRVGAPEIFFDSPGAIADYFLSSASS